MFVKGIITLAALTGASSPIQSIYISKGLLPGSGTDAAGKAANCLTVVLTGDADLPEDNRHHRKVNEKIYINFLQDDEAQWLAEEDDPAPSNSAPLSEDDHETICHGKVDDESPHMHIRVVSDNARTVAKAIKSYFKHDPSVNPVSHNKNEI